IEGGQTGYWPQFERTRRLDGATRARIAAAPKISRNADTSARLSRVRKSSRPVKALRSRRRNKNATPMQLSRHSLNAAVQKPLMAYFGRVHSIRARHSPRAFRNKGSVLRSSADEIGCLLPA